MMNRAFSWTCAKLASRNVKASKLGRVKETPRTCSSRPHLLTICLDVLQDNRDKRVELLQKYAYKFFPATKYMDYAVKVEAYTLGKAANLVLNVDGCIGALFLDLLNSSSQFTPVSLYLGLSRKR